MITIQDVFGAFFIAIIISYGFTPLARQIAFRIRLLDHPNSKKSHAHPIPLLGGLSMFMAFFTAVFFTTHINTHMYGILIGAAILMAVGIVDDRLGMMPRMKLSAQILVALIAHKAGVRIITFEDYYISMFFTVFWIVGITNAFNLLDNLNGLSSGIAGISSIFFGIIALMNSQVYIAILSFAMAGACFGFLKHNFPRASIFMGDSGSMFLGFVLACIAILGSWETEKISLSLSLPILILGYPIFDTTLVTFLRLREKRSIFIGGKDHSSHILASLKFKKKRAVLVIYTICVLLGCGAFLLSVLPAAAGAAILAVTAFSMAFFGVYLAKKRSKSAKRRRQAK
jgi:UDP-GlcNAc:undecaprenyl-phosphate GlcNAc-1-phosphate transferase